MIKKMICICIVAEVFFFTIFYGVKVAVGINVFLLLSVGTALFKALPVLLLRMKLQSVGKGVTKDKNKKRYSTQPEIVDAGNSDINDFVEEDEMLFDELFR